MTRALLAAVSLLALASPALAQEDSRLDRMDRQLRELRAIVFQGRDTGQPVVVKPAGPDPQVTALEQKVGDLEQTLQRVNGQLDTATQQLDDAKRRIGEQGAATSGAADQLKALSDRVARLEAALAPGAAAGPPPQAAAAPPPAEPPPEAAPPPPPPSKRSRGSDATARARASDRGSLGSAPAPPAAPAPTTEAGLYKEARRLLAAGEYPAAAAALQDFTTRYGSSPRLPEARYHLGEALFVQDNYPEAARNYALALRGWPKVGWAPDATLKLAQSLAALNRPADACAAVGEFQTRYAAAAPAALRSRAASVQGRAKCGS